MQIFNYQYNTSPCTLHNPCSDMMNYSNMINKINRTKTKWERLCDTINKSKAREKIELNDLEIITWNNKAKSLVERSLDCLGLPYVVLGKDIKKWTNRCKIYLTYEHLLKTKKKYIIGLDAFDVIIFKNPEYLIYMMNEFKLIFNSGGNNPFTNYSGDLEKFNYLNCGVWIGERDFCLTFWQEAVNYKYELNKESEQALIKDMIIKFYNDIDIDLTNRMFQIYPCNVPEEQVHIKIINHLII